MVTARRLYLYGVLLASLVLLLVGLRDLLGLLIEGLADTATGTGTFLHQGDRMDLALALAMIVVGGPLWVVHAWLLLRIMRESATAASEERASAVRATYFLLVLAGGGAVALISLQEVAQLALSGLMDVARPWDAAPGSSLATALVAGAAWFGHGWWRRDDLRREPVRLAGDWLTRAYLYGALSALAILALITAAGTIETVLRAVTGQVPTGESGSWWRDDLARDLGILLVALPAWATHWWSTRGLLAAPDPMGDAHRLARTRLGYLLGMVLVGVIAVAILSTDALGALLAWAMGAWRSIGGATILEDTIGPLAVATPFLVAWWWHRRRATREALATGGSARHDAVGRTCRALVALVGVLSVALGTTMTLETMLHIVAEDAGPTLSGSVAWTAQLARPVAETIVGLALWLPAWTLLQRQHVGDPVVESSATARRAYLLLVSGAAVIAAMVAGAWLVYRVLASVLDVGGIDARGGPELAVAVLLVAGTALAYHLAVLLGDLRIERAHQAAVAAPSLAAGAADGEPSVVLDLELAGPPDADVEAVTAALRSHLPAGFTLRPLGPAHR